MTGLIDMGSVRGIATRLAESRAGRALMAALAASLADPGAVTAWVRQLC